MAIAPSRLGEFVFDEGFSWPKAASEDPGDHAASDGALVRRLRETGLIRREVTDADILATLHAARREHAEHGYSLYNSPHERVRVFLAPYLTGKGRRWAVPLRSLAWSRRRGGAAATSLPARVTRPWWRFWEH